MATLTLEVEDEVLEHARREAVRWGRSLESIAVERVKELADSQVTRTETRPLDLATLATKHPLSLGRVPNREERTERYSAEERAQMEWLRDAAREGIEAMESGSFVTLTSESAVLDHLRGLRAAR